MQPGWYIVNHHDVHDEDSVLTRAIGGTTRPEVFRHHVDVLRQEGRFISIAEGQDRLEHGQDFDEPVFSLWFDDGYAGLAMHARPVCDAFGIRPALSICSRFILREEMFWRMKLSVLSQHGGLPALRSRLRDCDRDVPDRLRSWSLHHFSASMVSTIDEVYTAFISERFRADAYRLFLSPEQVGELSAAGWHITNHSAAHYPLAQGIGWDAVRAGFDECEALVRRFNPANRYWVTPFGFGSEHYLPQLTSAATVVEVGERRNTAATWRSTGRLFRFSAPSGRDIRAHLR